MNQEIIDRYHAEGFIKVPELFSSAEMDDIKSRLAEFIQCRSATLPESDCIMESDGRTIRNLFRMEEHDEFFSKLRRNPKISDIMRAIYPEGYFCKGVETFNKSARVGSAVPHHQDNAYFCYDPAKALTLWIAVDEVTEDNGPVHFVPGSHRSGVFPHVASGVKGNSFKLRDTANLGQETHVLLKPGDAVIHHCQVIHRSDANVSPHSRCGLLLVYASNEVAQSASLLEGYSAAAAMVD